MKLVRQLISAYLALCLAVAGAVGVSPWLHRLVEHGGLGPAHVHSPLGSSWNSEGHAHNHGGTGGHVHSHGLTGDDAPIWFGGILANNHASFSFSLRQFGELWHALRHLLAGPETGDDSPPDPAGDRHHHDSLPQSLVCGLLELTADAMPSAAAYGQIAFVAACREVLPLELEWQALMAGRGPPPAES